MMTRAASNRQELTLDILDGLGFFGWYFVTLWPLLRPIAISKFCGAFVFGAIFEYI
jgi:hypothetical protein